MKQVVTVARRTSLMLLSLSLILAPLILTGCGQETQVTTALPASLPVASAQPSAGTSVPTANTSLSDGSEAPSLQGANALSPEGETILADFMAKLNAQLDLDAGQQEQVKGAVRMFLIGMETKMQKGQLDGQSGQGRQSGTPFPPADGQPPDTTQMKQGQMGGPGQVTQQLQEVLTSDQLEVFQRLMEELRQEMILQRTIQQMGGTTPSNDENK